MNVLCIIGTEDRLFYMKSAFMQLEKEYPNEFNDCCYSVYELRNKKKYDDMLKKIINYDFAIVYFHGGAHLLGDFPGFWNAVKTIMPVFFVSSIPEEISEFMPQSLLSIDYYKKMAEYFEIPSVDNFKSMILIAANFSGKKYEIPRLKSFRTDGYYMPDGIIDASMEDEFIQNIIDKNKPIIGIIVHQNNIISENKKHIDSTINTLIDLGASPLPVFTRMANDEDKKTGIRHTIKRYFIRNGKVLPKSVIIMTGFSLSYMANSGNEKEQIEKSVLELLGVPALQMMTTRYSYKEYAQKPQGLDSMSLGASVFQTELDGQIITVPSSATETVIQDGIERKVAFPMEDRILRVCRMAVKWAALSMIPKKEKKIAIIFHNLPGNDRIGCAEGLDSFETVYNLVKKLKEDGIYTEYDFKNGQDIINRITEGLTNDLRFKSEDMIKEKAADLVPPKVYETWWNRCGSKVKSEISSRWGKAPGEVMAYDNSILIPGIFNGNIFIGIQPSRAFGEKARELYHSTDSTPPYSYMTFYRWLEEVFGADVICHIGTHGTLEWLPGKEIGLSSDCYPDLSIGSVPHLYIYNIGITGEGIQAKRRSNAVILEHMVPSMQESGTYGELSTLDEAVKEYYHARQFSLEQLKNVSMRIYEIAEKAEINKDIALTKKDYEDNPDKSIKKLHLWMGQLKNSVTRDGLHIFGKPPEGVLFNNLMRMLVRVKNGKIPSIYDAMLSAMGYDPKEIKDSMEGTGKVYNAQYIYDDAVKNAGKITNALAAADYSSLCIARLIEERKYKGDTYSLKEVLTFLCDSVKEKVLLTSNEMTHFIAGTNGRFVPPGKGGNPTRGNVEILPTGRNFYASDPDEIPSRAAYEVGRKLADKMLKIHLDEKGEYPQSVAMIIWAGATLKTNGEDLAEALSLMGVRPVYLGSALQVTGVEPIPAEELKRPRIDVTLRISGLFRDMYPNLIELVDKAVNCVSVLDESNEDNYIKKHVIDDINKLIKDGIDDDDAAERSRIRVFSAPPGAYGAGVAHLIDSKEWSDYKDISQVYANWGGHGYSSKIHGDRMVEMFEQRLSTVSMTIKNESNIETDMFSSDDFYAYHGGLAACVKKNSGKVPLSLTGHTEDIERPVIRSINEETARIMRTKILHPVWFEGLKRHGYKGAQEVVLAVNHLFGWDATAETAEDWMYQRIADKFLFNEENRKWLEDANKWSTHSISERLLEANQRGMWKASEDTINRLKRIYQNAEGLIEDAEDSI